MLSKITKTYINNSLPYTARSAVYLIEMAELKIRAGRAVDADSTISRRRSTSQTPTPTSDVPTSQL